MSMLSVGSKVHVSCSSYNRDTEEISGISPYLERTSICRMFTSTRKTLSRWTKGSKTSKSLCKVHRDDFYQMTSKWPDWAVTSFMTKLFRFFSLNCVFFSFSDHHFHSLLVFATDSHWEDVFFKVSNLILMLLLFVSIFPDFYYHKVAILNTSWLDAHFRFCRLLMKRN